MKCLTMFFLFFISILNSLNVVAAPQTLDRIVAVVNDNVITQSQLAQKMQFAQQQLQASGASPVAESALRKEVLQQMIDTDLQLQLAKKAGIKVSDEDVNAAISEIAKRNGLSLTQFQAKLKETGLSYTTYQQQIRDQMIISRVQERQLASKVVLNDQEIDELAKKIHSQPAPRSANAQYHIEDLLISLPDNPTTQQVAVAEQTAQALLQKARAGTSFQQIIQTATREQAISGGDLGWRPLKALPEVFTSVVQTMHPGDISKPLRTPNGMHLIKLVAVRGDNAASMVPAAVTTHVRHILIKITPLANDTQVRQRIAEIRADIARGGDFAKLATQYSQDPGSASKGGDLDWVHPGTLDPQFEAVMNKLKPGQISEPFKTQFGWHIVQVLERKSSKSDQTMLKAQARQMLYQRKFQEALQKWLQQLRRQSYVKIMD